MFFKMRKMRTSSKILRTTFPHSRLTRTYQDTQDLVDILGNIEN